MPWDKLGDNKLRVLKNKQIRVSSVKRQLLGEIVKLAGFDSKTPWVSCLPLYIEVKEIDGKNRHVMLRSWHQTTTIGRYTVTEIIAAPDLDWVFGKPENGE